MNTHQAYCGLECSTCPLYIATNSNDSKLIEKTRIQWGKLYNRSFTTTDMECYGCRSNKKFKLCALCDILGCCRKNSTNSCTKCTNYPCERLQKLYQYQQDNDTGIKKA